MPEKETSRNLTDPSALTTAQTIREVAALKELVFTRIEALEDAVKVAHDDLVRVPTDVEKAISGLKELLETRVHCIEELQVEKFKTIDKQFGIIEGARVEQKRDTATAAEAALRAFKEAVAEQNASNALAINKSEVNTTKQIDQQALQMATSFKAIEGTMADIKERLTKIEGVVSGVESMRREINGLKSGADEGKGKSGVTSPLMMLIAALVGGLVIWIIQQAIK